MNRQYYKQFTDKENGDVSFEIIDNVLIFRQNYYVEAKQFESYDKALSYVDAKMSGLKKTKNSTWKEVSTESSALLQQEIESLSILSFDDIVTYFEKIIEVQDNFLLLPFLRKIERKYVEDFRKHLRKLKKHYTTYVELRPRDPNKKNDYGEWGYRGTRRQQYIINASAFAMMDKEGIKSWDYTFEIIANSHIPTNFELIRWTKPSWLTDYLNTHLQKHEGAYISYSQVRLLENEGLIEYIPELFVQVLTRLNLYQLEQKVGEGNAGNFYKQEIFGDDIALKRDLPLIFEYETNLHHCNEWVRTGKNNEGHGRVLWKEIIEQALQEGVLDRLHFFENCLSMQSKNWNGNLLQFFRKQFEEAKPTTEELLHLQSHLFAILPVANKNVVNFAVNTLKSIAIEKSFQQEEFVEWVQTVMTNSECKTSIKTVLGIFDKYLKANSLNRERILCNIADVYCVNDLTLQDKATQLILKYASTDDVELASFLQTYQPQVLGNIATNLSKWLDIPDNSSTEASIETDTQYQCIPTQKPQLSNYLPIEVPATWNDFMFWIGKVISSENPIDFEVLMSLIMSQEITFPVDADAQLKVYRKQIENKIGYTRHYENLFLIQTLYEKKQKFEIAKSYDTYRSKNIKIKNNLIAFAFNLYSKQQNLCLLSLPTHEPYWIDASVLMQRIAQYQSKNVLMNTSDLAIAISRALPNPSQNIEPLLASIDPNLANLFRFYG